MHIIVYPCLCHLCVCPCLCVSICVGHLYADYCVSMSVSPLCLYPCLCVSMSLSPLCLSMSVYPCLPPLCLSMFLCIHVCHLCVCPWLFLFPCLWGCGCLHVFIKFVTGWWFKKHKRKHTNRQNNVFGSIKQVNLYERLAVNLINTEKAIYFWSRLTYVQGWNAVG